MSVSTELSPPISETRRIFGPGGNRVKVLNLKNPKCTLAAKTPQVDVQKNASVDSSCSSDSSSNASSVKIPSCKRREKHNRLKSAKVVVNGVEAATMATTVLPPFKRCDWITPFSDPLYTSFHDEEWAVPVHDDKKLFELLVLSQASAELTWPVILVKRDAFRKLFENFEPSLIAKFNENKLQSVRPNGSTLLSEQKFRAVVENANQVLKIQQEFGSFSVYCWKFINHKPIRNGFRYARQVPAKTPKSELISKDLMRRGFCCVGPIVVYSFMQVSGMVNDHLLTCFRYNECNNAVKKDSKSEFGKSKVAIKATEETNSSHD